MQINISYFDDPKLYDKFSRALKQSDIKTIDCFESVISLGCALCSVISLIVYISSLVPLLFILTILASIISFLCYYKLNKLSYAVYKETEINERENNYINRTFYLEKNAYDIKTTNISNLLLDKKYQTYLEYDKKYNKCEKKKRKYTIGEDAIYQVVTNFATYSYLMYQLFSLTYQPYLFLLIIIYIVTHLLNFFTFFHILL